MRIRIVVAVAVLLMGSVGFAQQEGRVERSMSSGTMTWPLCSCGTFEIYQTFSYDWVMNTRKDKDNNVVGYINQFKYYDNYYYNPEITDWYESGKYLVGKEEHSMTRDIGGVGYSSGSYNRVTIPGEGAVLLWIGHMAMDSNGVFLFQHGPAQVIEGDFGAICRAVAAK